MFDRPPPESALHQLRHEEPCIIVVDDQEYESIWSRNVYMFYFNDCEDVRAVSWSDVDKWQVARVNSERSN